MAFFIRQFVPQFIYVRRQIAGMPKEREIRMITIDAKKKQKDFVRFWDGFVFHPTDAIEDDWGQRILDRISSDKAAKMVRIYTMMEDIVTLDENGEMRYNFVLNDYRLDYLLSRGFDIMLAYAFLPPWLTVDADKTSSVAKKKTRYKDKMIVASYAKDYGKWQEICRKYTEHIVNRYGEETVAKWRLQCYNEPNLDFFFMAGEVSLKRRCEEYCKIYDGFEAGVGTVSKNLQIGGPAIAEPGEYGSFLEQFLRHVKTNHRKLNFVSFHTYGTSPQGLNSGKRPLNIRNSLQAIEEVVRICKEQGFSRLPLICDEWGAASHGFYNIEECPAFWFRETEVFSAYFTRMIALYDEMGLPLEKLMICLSGQHEMTSDFSGFRNFFSLHFYPKPIYNAHILASKLGNSKLCFEGEIPEHLSVIPTRHDDGHISILLGYTDDGFEKALEDMAVSMEIRGLGREYEVKQYILDKNHANAYRKYCDLGKPDHPTEEQKQEIRSFAALAPMDYGKVTPDRAQITFVMADHSTVLIELLPL